MAVALAALSLSGASGCDLGKITVNTTSKVLKRAQPALKQEADYDMAARALPGTLKTVEGFWFVNPNATLTGILAEGYCQYGVGFVEDEWELAVLARDLDRAEYLSARATKMFVRCTNYALHLLGETWKENIFGTTDAVSKLIASAGKDERTGLMWAVVGLSATINQNKDNIAVVSQLPTARMMLERVVKLDDEHDYRADMYMRALPHMALGQVFTAQAKALGGDPERGKKHFVRAIELTDNKLLLAKVLYARRYAVAVGDRQLFRKLLLEVVQTPPSLWPEPRLANEIAQRRARRDRKQEKDWLLNDTQQAPPGLPGRSRDRDHALGRAQHRLRAERRTAHRHPGPQRLGVDEDPRQGGGRARAGHRRPHHHQVLSQRRPG
ncbi:MAG: TRAP transporter TatT component family protein [Myxococcota bacterium]